MELRQAQDEILRSNAQLTSSVFQETFNSSHSSASSLDMSSNGSDIMPPPTPKLDQVITVEEALGELKPTSMQLFDDQEICSSVDEYLNVHPVFT